MTAFRQVLEDILRREAETARRESGSFTRTVISFEDMVSDIRELPAPARRPTWAEELGLDLPCDARAIKSAFRRLARRTHPDCSGGSHDAFLRAQRVLDEALAAVQETEPPPSHYRPRSPQVRAARPLIYA